MGLIKAATGAVTGQLADQWKEAMACPRMDNTVILRRGERMNQGKGSNTKGNPDLITNGSVILVEENTCMMTIDNGKITNIVTEPGSYTLDNSSAPSIFAGQILDTLKDTLKRFTFGGTPSTQQRVIYINLMPLPGIPFGTPTPVPYFDRHYNTSIDLRFHGTFEIQIPDAEAAVLFYQNVAEKGQQSGDMTVDEVFKSEQYKREFMQAMKKSLAMLSPKGIMYSQLSAYLDDLTHEAQEATKVTWREQRGLAIINVAIGPVTLSDESKALLGDRLKADTMLGGDVQRAMMAGSLARGIEAAGGNQGGAMMGFMGMNMAQQMGGNILGGMGQAPDTMQAQQASQAGMAGVQPTAGSVASAGSAPAPAGDSWTCACGAVNPGKFCQECGGQKPEESGWTCECGASNEGKFCAECGKGRG